MPEYRRVIYQGGTYFFTLVTYQRQKIFLAPKAISLLYASIEHVRDFHDFVIEAFCLLPDHIHFIWRLPEGDANYSMRIGQVKRHFSRQYAANFKIMNEKTISQKKRRELTIWQRRFWEHWIRDEKDLNQHIDYIHYNPVKHGLVNNVREWKESSFHSYVKAGYYDPNWGEGYKIKDKDIEFGE